MKILENEYGKYAIVGEIIEKISSCLVIATLRRKQVYEPETLRFIKHNVNNKSMVHAGTYIGDFLPALSSFTTGRIFAFEPNVDVIECAKETIKINNLTNVIFRNKALGKEPSTLDLIYRYNNNKTIGGGARFRKWGDVENEKLFKYYNPENKTVKVEVTTIDSVVYEPISIIQLDVEGYEGVALEGAIETINKYKPILILERVEEEYEILKTIKENLGYKEIMKLDGYNHVYAPHDTPIKAKGGVIANLAQL
tara:strand:- start:1849 stop:2607 length:759 start_codon:yes stop_codon:yes gene_type:complete